MCTHSCVSVFFFFFNDTATTEIYTLSLHDALPISPQSNRWAKCDVDFCLHGPKMSCRAWSDHLQLDGVAGLSQPCRLPASSHPSSEGGPPMSCSLEPKSQPRQY